MIKAADTSAACAGVPEWLLVSAESFLHAVLFAIIAKGTALFFRDGWIARRVAVGTQRLNSRAAASGAYQPFAYN
jgi:hypothetical protein